MTLIIYALALLTSFSGLIMGIVLSNIATEEIKSSSKYLKLLNMLLISATIFVVTYNISLIYAVIFTLLIATSLFIFRKRYNDAWIYSSMGALFYIALITDELLNASILMFIYGLSVATIYVSDAFNNRTDKHITFHENLIFAKKIILKHSFFLAIGIIFYIAFNMIK